MIVRPEQAARREAPHPDRLHRLRASSLEPSRECASTTRSPAAPRAARSEVVRVVLPRGRFLPTLPISRLAAAAGRVRLEGLGDAADERGRTLVHPTPARRDRAVPQHPRPARRLVAGGRAGARREGAGWGVRRAARGVAPDVTILPSRRGRSPPPAGARAQLHGEAFPRVAREHRGHNRHYESGVPAVPYRGASKEAPASPRRPAPGRTPSHPLGSSLALSLGALGVVYGDIGTSPLYAMQRVLPRRPRLGTDAGPTSSACSR